MKMDLVVEIKDAPGQLFSVLKSTRGLGVNLVTVIHKREEKNKQGNVPVKLTLQGEKESLSKVIDKFNERGLSILEVDGKVKKEIITSILIGHILDKDLQDSVNKINEMDGVLVVGLNIKLNGENKSSALINIEYDAGMGDIVLAKLAEIASKKDFIMINNV